MAKKERDAKSEPTDEKPAPATAKQPVEGDQHDYSYTQNREVSWLRFDDRVLEESYDESVPLYERLKFVSIFQSNLDEWFMIRIGGLSDLASLKHEPLDNKSHETPSQQLAVVMKRLPPLLRREERALETIESDLATKGLSRVRPADLTEADLSSLKKYFDKTVSPIISPMIVDPRHPFPNLRNGVLYCVCSLDGPEEKNVLGLIEVPPMLARVVELPSTPESFRYILVEDVILSRLDGCFGGYVPKNAAVIRVTRNADIDPDGEGVEEEEDYRQHMKKVLKKRLRLQPVRLEVNGALDAHLLSFVQEELRLGDDRIFQMRIPLDLSYVFALGDRMPETRRDELTFTPFEPQPSAMVAPGQPMREQIESHDVLLFYPYESMGPLLDLIREASADDECISIKITLYRVARQSRLCESLIAAAENGKDVTVLMELRARFDEENNIEWAERLDGAGCTVIYGSEGFKCHSKICQITYHDRANISRITCLGTGNFNEKTARLYSDFMLMTAHEGIAEDGNRFFRNLSLGNLRGTYQYLGVAPVGLKPLVMRGLDREIARAKAGEPAQVFFKMNSLTDRDVIDKLAEACQAGVNVLLVIRGICCIRADVPGKTAGLNVHQIVGRLLEHARVYAFGADVDTIYLSSADMMTRNTERRVEICYPVLDPVCRDLVLQYMNLQLADNVKARRLTAEGTWVRFPMPEGGPLVDSQETLIRLAYDRAQAAVRGSSSPLATVEQVMGQITPVLHMAPEEAAAARKATEQAKPSDFAKRPQPTPEPPVAAGQAPDLVAGPASSMAGAQPPEPKPEPERAPEPESEPERAETPMPESPTPDGPQAGKPAGGHSEPPRRGRVATAFALIGAGFRTLFAGSPDSRGDAR
jgi:polyphosphate kinase